MTLGEYLLQVRKERGYNSRELARRAGISCAEISRLETGQRQKPSPAILKKMAQAMAIDEIYLMVLAGYLPPDEKHEQAAIPAAIRDENGNAVDIHQCAEEMLENDPEWLRTAYLVSKKLSKEDRKLIDDLASLFINKAGEIEKENAPKGKGG